MQSVESTRFFGDNLSFFKVRQFGRYFFQLFHSMNGSSLWGASMVVDGEIYWIGTFNLIFQPPGLSISMRAATFFRNAVTICSEMFYMLRLACNLLGPVSQLFLPELLLQCMCPGHHTIFIHFTEQPRIVLSPAGLGPACEACSTITFFKNQYCSV